MEKLSKEQVLKELFEHFGKNHYTLGIPLVGESYYRGFKGFRLDEDKDMKCLEKYYYEGFEAYQSGDIVMCKNGIHACFELEQVLQYYSFAIGKVYHHVYINADKCEIGKDKVVSKSVVVGPKVSDEELDKVTGQTAQFVHALREFYETNPRFTVGGSFGLYLQGLIPYRKIKDIDFIISQGDLEAFKGHENVKELVNYDTDETTGFMYRQGEVNIDLLVGNSSPKTVVNKFGLDIPVADPVDTINARLTYENYAHKEETWDLIRKLKLRVG